MFTEDPWALAPDPGSESLSDDIWHHWTPEVLRAIGGASTCSMPRVEELVAEHPRSLMAWGPLLPLLHYHLGWVDVEAGLARWAMTGFDPMDDPTLTTIVQQWGAFLPAFTWWHVLGSHSTGKWGSEDLADKLPRAREQAEFFGNDELHLGGHSRLPVAVLPRTEGALAALNVHAPGSASLLLPTYLGWYTILEAAGMRLPKRRGNASWRVDVTIAPIGRIGQFRRSRETGRWFTGRHSAHTLGLPRHH